jgi:chemotaxis response regulator CheB
MDKRRILLVGMPNLLGEILERSLVALEDVQVVGSQPPGERVLDLCADERPDLVIVTEDEPSSGETARLTARLMDACPNLPIIRVRLDRNVLLLYTSQTIPARMADLVEAIRRVPLAGT